MGNKNSGGKKGQGIQDVTGQKFGSLRVISMIGRVKGRTVCECICDCGVKKIVNVQDIKKGCTISCGCVGRARSSDRMKKRLENCKG